MFPSRVENPAASRNRAPSVAQPNSVITRAPNEKPDNANGSSGYRSRSQPSAVRASSISPAISPYSPALAPTRES